MMFAACSSSGGSSGKMTYVKGESTEVKSCKSSMRGETIVAELQFADKSLLRIMKGQDTTYEYQHDNLTVELKCSSVSAELQTTSVGNSSTIKGNIELESCSAIKSIVLKLDC
jgi:hypothetical protein